jgi:hypothetical protein
MSRKIQSFNVFVCINAPFQGKIAKKRPPQYFDDLTHDFVLTHRHIGHIVLKEKRKEKNYVPYVPMC